ncbi:MULTISPECIES: protein-tyrosine phosphatase family protein [unclassified Brevibacterium]|uniref:phosphatase domain-containing protein n=1 Tax=unclassified Brevibacterium TaxID=2614124 RepID=UPI001E3B2545|nr:MULTISPECIES: protein-tyrosine phosphatase family protein [unclassified Brevibacterium]MCD1287414.1 protein phosphatase [Brevibacterium sp. CCUG 69071]MDK8436788.1 protein-tyrosine phosphatase family protein [Brevibacterium sp. H-BE7]
MSTWDATAANVLELPSGRLVRGRSLRGSTAADAAAEFELVLLGSRRQFTDVAEGAHSAEQSRWVKWPDFLLPSDRHDAAAAMLDLWTRAESSRVGVACGGGRGRTGTALACIAIIDGVAAEKAVEFVREGYDPKAVETPWQRRFVTRFPALLARIARG